MKQPFRSHVSCKGVVVDMGGVNNEISSISATAALPDDAIQDAFFVVDMQCDREGQRKYACVMCMRLLGIIGIFFNLIERTCDDKASEGFMEHFKNHIDSASGTI